MSTVGDDVFFTFSLPFYCALQQLRGDAIFWIHWRTRRASFSLVFAGLVVDSAKVNKSNSIDLHNSARDRRVDALGWSFC